MKWSTLLPWEKCALQGGTIVLAVLLMAPLFALAASDMKMVSEGEEPTTPHLSLFPPERDGFLSPWGNVTEERRTIARMETPGPFAHKAARNLDDRHKLTFSYLDPVRLAREEDERQAGSNFRRYISSVTRWTDGMTFPPWRYAGRHEVAKVTGYAEGSSPDDPPQKRYRLERWKVDVWVMTIASPGARGMDIFFSRYAVPRKGGIFVYGLKSDSADEANRRWFAGKGAERKTAFITSGSTRQETVIELHLPAGSGDPAPPPPAGNDGAPFAIDKIKHAFR